MGGLYAEWNDFRRVEDDPVTLTGAFRRTALATLIILIAIGVIAGIARAVYPTTLGTRAEMMRERVWGTDAADSERRSEVAAVEARFVAYPLGIFVHASVGALVMLAGGLQFVPYLRNRYINFHRWNGRFLVAMGLVVAIT